jgi:hypothetical protein
MSPRSLSRRPIAECTVKRACRTPLITTGTESAPLDDDESWCELILLESSVASFFRQYNKEVRGCRQSYLHAVGACHPNHTSLEYVNQYLCSLRIQIAMLSISYSIWRMAVLPTPRANNKGIFQPARLLYAAVVVLTLLSGEPAVEPCRGGVLELLSRKVPQERSSSVCAARGLTTCSCALVRNGHVSKFRQHASAKGAVQHDGAELCCA